MNITVVIPVFNSAHYLKACLNSVIELPGVVEVVVVDDGSTDCSWNLILEACMEYPQIKSFHHPRRQNLGRSATRNLGLKMATSPWIAFLDSDDYYFKHRFDHLLQRSEEEYDGFYDSICTIYDEERFKDDFPFLETGVSEAPQPHLLLDYLIQNDSDHISLNGLTVRKTVCQRVGGFDETLKTGEDTDFVWRIAAGFRLISGEALRPVAARRIHGHNTLYDTVSIKLNRSAFYTKWTEKAKNMPLQSASKIILRNKQAFYNKQTSHGGLCSRTLRRIRYIMK